LAQQASAESGNANPGFVVSPIYQNVSVSGDQQQPHYVVTLTNHSDADQAFKLSTVDFGSLQNSAGVAFLGTSSSDFAKKYGLSALMALDTDSVTVKAGQRQDIGVTIKNSDTLTSGGHYGAIMATAQTAPGGAGAKPRVGVFEVLSSLILLIKQPGATGGLDLTAQSENSGLGTMPTTVTDKFANTGNSHVVPRGTVVVKDPLGRAVERGALNENSGIILPEGSRSYDTPLMTLARATMPGSYTVVTTYRYDGTEATKTYTSSFWYLGEWGMAGAGLILLGVLMAGGLIFRRRLRFAPWPRARS
jgi:hypothetical protein